MAFSQTAGLVGLPRNSVHPSLSHSLLLYGLSNSYFLPFPSSPDAAQSPILPHSISHSHTSVTLSAETAEVWQLVRGGRSNLEGTVIS